MTKVEFYILDDNSRQDRYHLSCRIAEKAWKNGNRVVIQVNSAEEAQRLNQQLWTFRDQSFVPHDLLPNAEPETSPVLIGWSNDAGDEHDVLINLADEVPSFFSSFERVIEPVDHEEGQRELRREHYRYYRDRGYPLRNQEITS